MSDARRPHGRTVSTFVAILGFLGATIGACTVLHPDGESCLKDTDCISGVCVAQLCGQPNPTLVGNMYPDDGGGETDSAAANGRDSGTTSTPDSGETDGQDSSTDGPPGTDSGSPGSHDSGQAVDSSDSGDLRDTGAPPVDADASSPEDADTPDSATGEDACVVLFAPRDRSV